MVKFNVAIVELRVRFPADAIDYFFEKSIFFFHAKKKITWRYYSVLKVQDVGFEPTSTMCTLEPHSNALTSRPILNRKYNNS